MNTKIEVENRKRIEKATIRKPVFIRLPQSLIKNVKLRLIVDDQSMQGYITELVKKDMEDRKLKRGAYLEE